VSPQEWSRAKSVLIVAADLEEKERTRLIETHFPDRPTLHALLSMLEVHDKIKRDVTPAGFAELSAVGTPQAPASQTAAAEQVIRIGEAYGPYRVVRPIGAGGMGQVFLAEDMRLLRPVALKSLAASWLKSPTARQRLLREARTAASLSHSNIVTLYDILEDEQFLLLVMEYVEGRTAAALAADGPMPLGHALRLMVQICDAVVYAHDRGIIHCDLKPSNVQVLPDGTAKVLDFGLARAKYGRYEIDPEARELLLIGTPPYMPPERLLNRTVNVSGDIYSLGVTLFELVTGRLPFEETNFAALIGAIIGTTAPRVSSIAPTIPPSLDDAVARAMAKDPKERYQTVREFSKDLQDVLRVLDNEGVATPRTNQAARFYSHTMSTGLGILALVFGLTFVGFITSILYSSPLGLTTSFEEESPLSWPVWGLRSLMVPLGQIGAALLLLGVGIQLWHAALAMSARLRNWHARVRSDSKFANWLRATPIRSLGGPLLIANVIALTLFWWRFRDLFESMNNFILQFGSLVALDTANASEHKWYMRVFSILVLAFGWSWYRVWKSKSLARGPENASTLAAGMAVMILSVFLMAAPYRLFFQSKGERVSYQSMPCYLIGRSGKDVMLFCPTTQSPPWSRLVDMNDPALKHTGVRESIFSATRGK